MKTRLLIENLVDVKNRKRGLHRPSRKVVPTEDVVELHKKKRLHRENILSSYVIVKYEMMSHGTL